MSYDELSPNPKRHVVTFSAHGDCTHVQGPFRTALAVSPACNTECLTFVNSGRPPTPTVFTQLTPTGDDLGSQKVIACFLTHWM